MQLLLEIPAVLPARTPMDLAIQGLEIPHSQDQNGPCDETYEPHVLQAFHDCGHSNRFIGSLSVSLFVAVMMADDG